MVTVQFLPVSSLSLCFLFVCVKCTCLGWVGLSIKSRKMTKNDAAVLALKLNPKSFNGGYFGLIQNHSLMPSLAASFPINMIMECAR